MTQGMSPVRKAADARICGASHHAAGRRRRSRNASFAPLPSRLAILATAATGRSRGVTRSSSAMQTEPDQGSGEPRQEDNDLATLDPLDLEADLPQVVEAHDGDGHPLDILGVSMLWVLVFSSA